MLITIGLHFKTFPLWEKEEKRGGKGRRREKEKEGEKERNPEFMQKKTERLIGKTL